MSEIFDKKLKANELRKKGEVKAALPLYKELWEQTHDKYDLAGLLFCYRKEKLFEDAIPLADEAFEKFRDFDWCRNEFIWTYIQGKVFLFPEDGNVFDLIDISGKIVSANPDEIALKVVVFKLLKHAKRYCKKQNDWSIVNEWIVKINPEILTGYTDETTGWTDKELWFYYRINGLIHSQKELEGIELIDNNHKEFFRQNKFFLRLKAKAFINLNKIQEAEAVYKKLVANKADWWLYHEFGKLLLMVDKKEEALGYFISSAGTPPMKMELKVSLFSDLGILLIKLGKKEAGIDHLLLSRAIRKQNDWKFEDLDKKIGEAGGIINEDLSISNLLKKCKEHWNSNAGKDNNPAGESVQTRNLQGKLISNSGDKPYRFIKTRDNKTYFCSKSDLPKEANEDTILKFDIKRSFDKKKNAETFKAVNITLYQRGNR